MNADKTEYMCFNQKVDISILNGGSLRLVDKFTYLGSRVSSTENGLLSMIWKSDLSDKIKRNFFQAEVVSVVLYRCTTWMLMKCREKKKKEA